jgi:hypothetical protein
MTSNDNMVRRLLSLDHGERVGALQFGQRRGQSHGDEQVRASTCAVCWIEVGNDFGIGIRVVNT